MIRWFSRLATILVSLVFVAAGMTKFAAPEGLSGQLHVLNLPFPGLFPWLALGLPIFEVLLGVALWFKHWRVAAWLGILPLTVVFSAVLAWAWAKGLNISCGCFGDVLHFSLAGALLRNVLILAAGSWVLYRDAGTIKNPGR